MLVFTRQAVDCIYEHSGGIPRLISVICDNALISGFAADRRPVGRDIVDDVCRDFDLTGVHTSPADSGRAGMSGRPAPARHVAEGSRRRRRRCAKPAAGPRRGLFEHFKIRRRFSLF